MNTVFARLTLAAVCGMAAVPSVSHALMPIYMKVEGVKGDVQSAAEIESFEWQGASNPGAEFTRSWSASAGGVQMIEGPSFGAGQWQNFSLTVQEAGTRTSEPYFQITMSDFTVSSTAAAGRSHKEWITIESMSQPLLRYRPLRPDGLRGDAVSGTWDAAGRFIGDPTVFDALAEIGALRGLGDTLSVTSAVPEPASWALWLVGAAVAVRRLRGLPR